MLVVTREPVWMQDNGHTFTLIQTHTLPNTPGSDVEAVTTFLLSFRKVMFDVQNVATTLDYSPGF